MQRLSLLRIALVATVAAFGALASAQCNSTPSFDCVDLCRAVLPCNYSYDQCISMCTSQEDKCERVGHPAVFTQYISCATDAGFTCNDADTPIANPPCGPAQAELVTCESNDATLDIPDGAADANLACVDASSCLSCCIDLWSKGAKEFAEAVSSCVCGETGKCRKECANEAGVPNQVCAKHPTMPDSGDPCDLCVSGAINEQVADVGTCVIPVTKQCNESAECASYVECVSQAGCTN
jgi:hypothetical protein